MNPKVGSWNGLLSGGRTPHPTPLKSMPDANPFGKPFVVNSFNNLDHLQVSSDDALWRVNMFKVNASTNRIPDFVSTPGRSVEDLSQNRISSRVQFPTSYHKNEETMHGKCLVR